jgi:hypothetical protein
MDFDAEEYRKQVLDPARRRGNVPPADLFVRYGVDAAARYNGAAFAAHVEDMAKHWRALKQKRVYAKIAQVLLAGHAELAGAGELSWAGFDKRLRADRARERPRLEQRVQGLADGIPCISRSRLDALLDTFGGLWDEKSVAAVLRRLKIDVIEQPWELPPPPAGNKHKDLAANLTVLGLRLAAELVLGTEAVRKGFRLRGGFRLASAGPALTVEEIQRVRATLAERTQDERKTAKDNVLTILLNAAKVPSGLEALLVWELAELLQPLVATRLPVRVVADEAAQLGLDGREALDLAVALVEASGGRRTEPDPAVAAVLEALAAGRLRAAQRLAASLPASADPELRGQVDAEVSRVAGLVEQAERSLRDGESEAAVELLAQAVKAAVDDEPLRHRLEAIPPPPAAGVKAGIDGGRVVVGWAPSPARTGTPRYRVVRTLDRPAHSATQAVRVGDTAQHEVTDSAPPAGEQLFYTVFATRAADQQGAELWSEPAVAEPVLLTPEVVGADVVFDDHSVTGSWQVPDGVAGVEVVRSVGAPPASAEGEPVPATSAGFVDAAVQAGRQYYYRVRTIYFGHSGARRVSPGVLLRAVPQGRLVPVHDLQAEVQPGDLAAPDSAVCTVQLSWTAPPAGSVSIRVASTHPPWSAGSTVPLAELTRHGRPLPGVPEERGDGTMALRTTAGAGRCYLIPVTVGSDTAVVGTTVVLAMISPVQRLRQRRFGEVVRLSWNWPPDVSVCRVRWRPTWDGARAGAGTALGVGTANDGGQRDCTRRSYDDDGGFKIAAGAGGLSVSVQALIRDTAGETASNPVTVEVPANPATVRYSFQRTWVPWRARRVRLVLSCDRACLLPALVVVHSADRVLPLSASQAGRIGSVPAQWIDPSAPLAVKLTVPGRRGSGWLACFVEDGWGDEVVLVREVGGGGR